jgi:drug/metabolite transporter (DMT)-like permease
MKWKWEHVFSIVIVAVLTLALGGAFWLRNMELINVIITAFIGGLSAITTFFFTKHRPDKKDDEQ